MAMPTLSRNRSYRALSFAPSNSLVLHLPRRFRNHTPQAIALILDDDDRATFRFARAVADHAK
jgi:hypothetical protein